MPVLSIGNRAFGAGARITQLVHCPLATLPDGSPKVVVILADGIDSSVARGSYTPANFADPTWSGTRYKSYCVPYKPGASDPASVVSMALLPPPLASLFGDYAKALLPNYSPREDQSQLLTNRIAEAGAVFVPFSYRGAQLSLEQGLPRKDAVLNVTASAASDPGEIIPGFAAAVLEGEISSIHKCWPYSKIVVVAHSEGGLVASTWFFAQKRDPKEVYTLFALDSPINGVQNTTPCMEVCFAFGVYLPVSYVWSLLWDQQNTNDTRWIQLDRSQKLMVVGTQSDPVYNLSDAPSDGYSSQLLHTGPCILGKYKCDYLYHMNLSSNCGTNSTSGPLGGMNGHGLVMNCTNVEDAILGRIETAMALATSQYNAAMSESLRQPPNNTAPGFGSPQSALAGLLAGILSSRPTNACKYVLPYQRESCFYTITGFTFSAHVAIHRVITEGTRALIELTGTVCELGVECVSNGQPNAGMPNAGTQFENAYSAAVYAVSSLSPVPCREIDGRWYLDAVFQ